MKYRSFIILIAGLLLLPGQGCKQQRGTDAERAEEMISAKTLGLAYLEEGKLEEAEAEFLKIIDLDADEVMGYANLGIVYLRMGSFDRAEEWLQKAIKMEPEDPDVRLILAKVFEMSGASDKAVEELEKIMEFSPGHVKSLFNLTELYASMQGQEAQEKRLAYTRELAGKVPGNIVPRLNLLEILIAEGETDEALAKLEELQQVFPEFPREAVEYYDQSLEALRKPDMEKASVSFMIFHNYMKVTTPYQAGMMDLKGPGGALVGSPVITFDQTQMGFQAADWEEMLAAIKFTDITATAGLDFLLNGTAPGEGEVQGTTHLEACDYNGDGDVDLYAGRYDPATGTYQHYLLKNEWGAYQDVSVESGINHQGAERAVHFADYDNDGFLDIYVLREETNILYRSSGEETFADVTAQAGVGDDATGAGSLFFDYDHDGDLDIFISRSGANLLYRNNMDGTFLEQGVKSGLAGGDEDTRDAAFGDFDEDGDIDLVVINHEGNILLYSNQRQGIFRDISREAGIPEISGATAVSVGDYNNDGFLDLFLASAEAGASAMYLNDGSGTFSEDLNSEELSESLKHVRVSDAELFDFDNDGFLDLLVVGESTKSDKPGVYLYHSDGNGKLWLSPGILPDDLLTGSQITTFDYNNDGDLDLGITGSDGSIRLLRNDGGNNNHFIKMKLVGLRAGSAKNNYYGIGAKVEVRAGSLYQSKVVTGPDIHFGLGLREKAEVIRILWTNGVPQNMFFPATNQDLIEEQQLKGSCPFLYTWNGEEYAFVKDIMWKSALGMPLGIMGENSTYAPSDASVDYIKIPGEQMKMKDHTYTLRITDELWETLYMDKIGLVVLDHPEKVDLYVDERMGPPSLSGYKLYQVEEKLLPVSVTDQYGSNLLSLVAERDNQYTPFLKQGKYQGLTEMSEITIDPGDIDPEEKLFLYLYGWIFPTDASINASISQSDEINIVSPVIEALNEQGRWEVIVDHLGFPMGKDKMLVADLSGKVSMSDPRIRIRTNMQVHWDQIFFSQGEPEQPVRAHSLVPSAADLHYRGFSKPNRKGGRYGPHWFDYSTVTTDPIWRDLTGNYTRFGDVLPLLLESDDMYVIKNAGDETTIEFDASSLPELPEGWTRDFLVHSVGWVKDGDLNTVHGQTVEPLPFHDMTSYPYGADEAYPSDPEHKAYLEKYNTRYVGTEAFTRALISEKE
ncbi:MAG: FG-GAP-like repeat-containing protein [Bacteroidota bacterium]|nr:FG-GAP-like repeat-containing protein [Bacteroidota bacterium]